MVEVLSQHACVNTGLLYLAPFILINCLCEAQPLVIISKSPKVQQNLMKRNKAFRAQGTTLAFKLLKSKSNECVQDAPE